VLEQEIVSCTQELKSLEELSQMTEKEFLRIRNVGKKTAIELTELLKEHGMDWKA